MDTRIQTPNLEELLTWVRREYGIQGESIRLYRESDGKVYFINIAGDKKVLKLYLPMQAERAIQSTKILRYLEENDFPVVHALPTLNGELYAWLDQPDGRWIGVLFDYARGKDIGFLHRWREERKQPPIHPKARLIGRQVGRMHRLMERYDGGLIVKGKARYIDDWIGLMRRDGHDPDKIEDLRLYGDQLWAKIKKTPAGFCHGDMHTGNTRYYGGQFTWMDFDRASVSHPILDVAWLSDATDFNAFDDNALRRSAQLFEEIYAGYQLERTLNPAEIEAVFDGIAVIHYDLFASITIRHNMRVRKESVDEQHGWLLRWRDLCSNRIR